MSKEFEHEYTEEIVCSDCGCPFSDSYEYVPGEEDMGLIDCPCCGKEFYATREIEITYSTEKAKYGTCRRCGIENTLLQDLNMYSRARVKVKDYCKTCIEEVRDFGYIGKEVIDND